MSTLDEVKRPLLELADVLTKLAAMRDDTLSLHKPCHEPDVIGTTTCLVGDGVHVGTARCTHCQHHYPCPTAIALGIPSGESTP